MTIVADTSGLLAYFNSAEPLHQAVTELVADARRIVVSPYVIAELGYITGTRVGVDAAIAVIEELSSGAYELAAMDRGDLTAAASVMARFSDQPIGIADASLVVLAERVGTRRILTLDHRHFAVLRTNADEAFDLLPANPAA